jgi:DNA-binding transcriptional LysR family regulator
MAFEWSDARVFLAIHRAKSLSAAGRQLKVDQTTVGRRLAALEEALGAHLFDRTPDGYAITAAGERFLAHAERIECEADDVAREIAGEEARLTGTVRVTSADAIGLRVLTPLLARFHARYPEIELVLVSDSRILSLTKREADIGIRTPRPKEPSLITRRVMQHGYGLYASRAYLEARGTPAPDSDFEGHDLIGFEDDIGAEGKWLAQRTRRGRVVVRLNRTLGAVELARLGVGVALLPCYVADPEPELVRILGPEETLTTDMWLVMHKDMRHAARIRTCADFIVEELATREGEFLGLEPPGHAAARSASPQAKSASRRSPAGRGSGARGR